jgi:hypothetical protein
LRDIVVPSIWKFASANIAGLLSPTPIAGLAEAEAQQKATRDAHNTDAATAILTEVERLLCFMRY